MPLFVENCIVLLYLQILVLLDTCTYLHTVHTTYIDISYINVLLILACFFKSEFLPNLLSAIIVLYIDNLSLLFSFIDIDNIKVTKQKRGSDKKTISFTFLSLSECLMLMCYIEKSEWQSLWYRSLMAVT